MLDLSQLENASYLDQGDIARAEQFVAEGMTEDQALGYLQSWANQYAWDCKVDGLAAAEFERNAY